MLSSFRSSLKPFIFLLECHTRTRRFLCYRNYLRSDRLSTGTAYCKKNTYLFEINSRVTFESHDAFFLTASRTSLYEL